MATLSTRDPRAALEQKWTLDDAASLYQVPFWGAGYFTLNGAGHVCVRPGARAGHEIDLHEVIEGLRERGITTPVIIRFSDILTHRLRAIADAFSTAIAENEYRNRYVAVYPIKVNQQRPVVEEVFASGRDLDFGLEVGSKPELLAVMALSAGETRRLIVCNGFKDDAYIEAVILAAKLGRNIIPVVENFGELRLILKYARQYDVRPNIGVRVKLSSQGAGRWRDSAGAKSKFGLFVNEVLDVLRTLKEAGMADCLKLVHCHPGSQIQDIRYLKDAIGELAHVYCELHEMGAGVEAIDVGGGLGVDYDGSRTNFPSSMNYTLQEYASEVVYRIGSVCNEREVPHPLIVSESGRAIAAYQSVLVFNVLGSTGLNRFRPVRREDVEREDQETPQPLRDLLTAYESVSERRLIECFHDAVQAREQAFSLFNLGYLNLELRGLAEQLFWATCARIRDIARGMQPPPEELEDLELILSETYFCNFSVFQSMPDSWAIGHLFPIMPIHRLLERPTVKATLADITCDSDGKIDRFVDQRDVRKTIDLHELQPEDEYYLGAFLVGAYQETLGDLHNLFGDTHVVHLRLHDKGGWWIEEMVKGDTAREVLSYVQYDVEKLSQQLARDAETAVRDGRMTVAESRALLRFYEAELNGYTYLNPD
ncbi:MAG: biosynthetic arginine decarboxylase [Phycisphaeraceae bacterium]|nr:biosynthetic arginine decarboxylase [Phycisphaeraceae bacterium]